MAYDYDEWIKLMNMTSEKTYERDFKIWQWWQRTQCILANEECFISKAKLFIPKNSSSTNDFLRMPDWNKR